MKDETRRKLTCALALLAGFSFGPAVPVAAVSRDMLHDVSGEIASLRQARDEIMYYHQAQAERDARQRQAEALQAQADALDREAEAQEAAQEADLEARRVAAVQQALVHVVC